MVIEGFLLLHQSLAQEDEVASLERKREIRKNTQNENRNARRMKTKIRSTFSEAKFIVNFNVKKIF